MLLPHAQSSGQGGVWPWLMMECAEQFSYVVLKPLPRHKACVGLDCYANAEVNSAVLGLEGCTCQAFRPTLLAFAFLRKCKSTVTCLCTLYGAPIA